MLEGREIPGESGLHRKVVKHALNFAVRPAAVALEARMLCDACDAYESHDGTAATLMELGVCASHQRMRR